MSSYKKILSTLEKGFLGQMPIYLEKNMGTLSGGRRLAKNDVAGGGYDVFDLGEDERTISLNLYAAGDDFYAQAERLVKVLNSGEQMDLVHPFFRKKMTVLCKTWTYDTVSQTYQSIKATFTVLAPSGASFKDKLNDFLDKVQGYINRAKYYLTQGMGYVAVGAQTADNVLSLFTQVDDMIGGLSGDLKNNLDFASRWESLKHNVKTLANNVMGLVDALVETFTFGTVSLWSKEAVDSLLDVSLRVASIPTKDDFSGVVRDALVLGMVVNYVAVVQNYPYKSTEEQREQIYKLDLILSLSKVSTVYDSLLEVKNQCVKYLYDNVAPKVYSKRVSDNILNAVFFQQGSLDALEDVLDENKIDDPFYIHDKEVKFYVYD